MKSKIFLYLFIFASLIGLYLFVSGNKMNKAKDDRLEKMDSLVTALKDSLKNSKLQVLDMQYFSLENNDDALAYYDHLNLKDPAGYIADKLLETNERKGDRKSVV